MTTSSIVEVSKKVAAILDEDRDILGLHDIYYGRQEIIPKFPSISVESGGKSRRDRGTHLWDITFTINVMVFHGKLQASEVNQEEIETLAEAVESILHVDHKLGGLVEWSYVTDIEPLVIIRNNTMIKTSRLILGARSREVF